MTIASARSVAKLTVTETLSGVEGASVPTVTYSAFDQSNSVSEATLVAAFTQALSGGAATIDLSALPDAESGTSRDATGLKLLGLLAVAKSDNAGAITITPGASNGYNLFGDASGQITLNPGDYIHQNTASDGLDEIGASDDEIDLSGSGTDEIDLLLLFG